MHDVVIIGAGHNGLIVAGALARAGRAPLVLERSDRLGGCAVSSEIAPGYRCPLFAHRAALDPAVVEALKLERHGLEVSPPAARLCAPGLDGTALTLWTDRADASRDIAAFSAADAASYPRFLDAVAAVSAVLRPVMNGRPPSLDRPALSDLIGLLKTGRKFRALDRKDAHRLLRWMSMSVADLAHEWFESEPLCAAVAAGGLLGLHAGPRSPGTAASLLWLAAGEGHSIAPGWSPRGGMGALGEALAGAAAAAGATIRKGAEVGKILVEEGSVTGVVLSSGEHVAARRVVSNLDPRRTLLGLVGANHLPPAFARDVRHIRMRGTLAKVNYAVSSLPEFSALAGWDPARRRAALSGCVRLCPSMDAMERAFDAAKYGRYGQEPWIELAIPSLLDPELASRGGHVVSAYVQYAPYDLRDSTWDLERQRFGDVVTSVIGRYAPGFEQTVVARQVVTPLDLEREIGLTGGQIFHGELALDQLFLARPVLGWERYRTPIRGLFLCGTGTHPGSGLDGRAGWLAAKEILRD
jgi:phytoene dehydrogenase-like protein